MKWSELPSGLIKSAYLEFNPGINIQKAPSSRNRKHYRTVSWNWNTGRSLTASKANICRIILVLPECKCGLNNHKLLFKVENFNTQHKRLIKLPPLSPPPKRNCTLSRSKPGHWVHISCIPGALLLLNISEILKIWLWTPLPRPHTLPVSL
jgi:hypothetical protein